LANWICASTNLRTPRKRERARAAGFKGSSVSQGICDRIPHRNRDRPAIASIRRLVEIGHISEARAALKRLFPAGSARRVVRHRLLLLLGARPTDSRRRTRASAVWPTVSGMIHATSWHWPQLMLRQRHTALAGLTLPAETGGCATMCARRMPIDCWQRACYDWAPNGRRQRAINAYLARHPEDARGQGAARRARTRDEERGLLSPQHFPGAAGLQQRMARIWRWDPEARRRARSPPVAGSQPRLAQRPPRRTRRPNCAPRWRFIAPGL